jgi:hypothetical protein
VYDNIERNKQLLLDDLRVLEGLDEERGFNDEDIMRKVVVINDLERKLFWRNVL